MDIEERRYIAISVKHSVGDKFNNPTLWGCRRTEDSEERCFAGYTGDIKKAELYSLKDFQQHYGHGDIKCDEAAEMKRTWKSKYKNYDTILVDEQELKMFLKFMR